MVLLDMRGGEGNSGERYLLVGRKYYSVGLDQVGRMVSIPQPQGDRVGEAVLWTRGLRGQFLCWRVLEVPEGGWG